MERSLGVVIILISLYSSGDRKKCRKARRDYGFYVTFSQNQTVHLQDDYNGGSEKTGDSILIKKIPPNDSSPSRAGTSEASELSGSDGFCRNVTGTCNPRASLVSTLFNSQIPLGRPYCGNDDAINVTVDVALRQLMELDEPRQVLKVYVWIRMNWNDCNLVWNASDYAGIDNMVVPFETIWIPDISLYDSAAEQFYGYREFRPQVHSNGDVAYNFPSVIESQCLMDVRYFPFDTQKCNLTFGSWAHHGLEVDFKVKRDDGDLSTAQTNTEWKYISFSAGRYVTTYKCCPEPYPDVTFTLVIERKPLFYLINIIIPTFVVTLMAVLVFLLPAESGEKVGLAITIMLALSVFQLLVSDSLPPSAETIPLIAVFFDFMLFLCGFACIIATVVINTYFINNRKMSTRTRYHIVGPLARILCIRIPEKEETKVENNNNPSPTTPQLLKISKALEFKENGSAKLKENGSIKLENITFEKEKSNDEEPITDDWKLLSTVIDRIGLGVFLVAFVTGVIVIAGMYAGGVNQ